MLKKWLYSIDDILAVIAISTVSILTIVNVFCRFILNSPISWVEEVTLGCFVWLVFIGISSAMKRDGHIGVDYFMLKLPKNLRNILNLVGAAVIYFVLIYMFIYLGWDLATSAGGKLTPVLGINYLYIDIAVPLGGFLTAIHFTIKLIHSFRKNGDGKENI